MIAKLICRPFHFLFVKRQIGLLFVLFTCTTVNAQFSVAKLEEQFNGYHKKVLQEKLYMHVDRNFYLAGDIVWFKMYLVDAWLHKPLGMSKVAYAELLDANNVPVLQAKVAMENGSGNGSVSLPVTIASGHYTIRAYTNWMKNAGADYFFQEEITIVNTQKNRDLPASPAAKYAEPDIRFFPEGGDLVAGIPSKIACKVQGTDGKGLAFRGGIINENSDTLVRFQALQFGMGSFHFTPLVGHRYKAVVTINNKTFIKELPEIHGQGYVMRLRPADNKSLTITVQTNLKDASQVSLLVHTRRSVKLALQGKIENGEAEFRVEKDKLGDGISHFTVFNSDGKPVCERLYFVFPRQQLDLRLSGVQAAYDTRSNIDIAVQPDDHTGKKAEADMSVSVYRLDELQEAKNTDIRGFLLLSSDLQGRVESPDYYFGPDTATIVPAIDNLMLTQGWRRFRWDDVLQDKTPLLTYVPEVNGHIVTGKVVSTVTGKPVQDVEAYLSVPGLNTHMLASISDAEGKIKFDSKRMKGSQEIILQTNPNADTLVRVELSNPFHEAYSSHTVSPLFLSAKSRNSLLDLSIGVQVQNVYAGSKLKQLTQYIDTVSLFGKPDAVYYLDDFVRFSTIEEVLREYVGMMNVQKRRDGFSFQLVELFSVPIPDVANKQLFTANPQMMIDGVPVFDPNRLVTIDPLKLRKLEVYNRRYFQGGSFFSGLLNFTTYKGNLANIELDPRALSIDYEGLQLQREFYSPVYDTPEKIASHLPDYRTLLYWSPTLPPDAKGERHIRFFSSDKKGDYIVVVQGLSVNGQCGTAVARFEVK